MNPLKRLTSYRLILPALALAIAGCDGGSSSSPPVIEEEEDVTSTYSVTLTADKVVGGSSETGSGTAMIDVNETQNEIEASVSLMSVQADGASIRSGYAGDTGAALYTLSAGANADEWVLDATPLAAGDLDAIMSGSLYLEVTTATDPDGALRGQILPADVSVERIDLDASQVPAGSTSAGTGTAWLTIDSGSQMVAAHLRTSSLMDADSARLGRGVAGASGTELVAFAQDTAEPSHWLLDNTAYSAEMEEAAGAGELHAVVTTPTLPNGAIRGQMLPSGYEVVATVLESDAVVLASPAAKSAATTGTVMTTIGPDSLTSRANLNAAADADAVQLRRAPAGQNGPLIASFEQDLNDPDHWILEIPSIDPSLQANLDSQTLYVSVTTPAAPEGVARGQIVTAESQTPIDDSAFIVVSVDPPNAAQLAELPDSIGFTLNRPPLPESVSSQAVLIESSGGDGSFGDGNETVITPAAVSANADLVSISLAGVQAADDVYRVQLTGDGIVDESGIPLDGDQDGAPGGVFELAFELEQVEITATLSEIQSTIFNVSCALSGCHTGQNPPDGLDLSEGVAWSNIVDVASVQMPQLLRIEPGDPGNSYLVRKIEGSGIVANRMPLGRDPLSDEQIELVRQWVVDGAQDN